MRRLTSDGSARLYVVLVWNAVQDTTRALGTVTARSTADARASAFARWPDAEGAEDGSALRVRARSAVTVGCLLQALAMDGMGPAP